jgi:hypothetical protein
MFFQVNLSLSLSLSLSCPACLPSFSFWSFGLCLQNDFAFWMLFWY